MITKNIGGNEIKFSNTLRVMYELRAPFNVKTFQEVLERLQASKGFDDHLVILYTSYKVATPDGMDKDTFINTLLDNLGIVSVANLSGEIIQGMLYMGASEDEKAVAEKNAQELLSQNIK